MPKRSHTHQLLLTSLTMSSKVSKHMHQNTVPRAPLQKTVSEHRI